MQQIVSINPFRCRMWDLHSRLEQELSEETCKAELESIAKHGQLVPVLGRTLRGDPSYDVELIYGARRLFVARNLNRSLNVELRDIADKEALAAMDIENRHRRDISPYERGMSYAQWLRSGLFTSQEELAKVMNISSSQVSRLLRLARLPSVVIGAFGNPTNICERWGLRLADALDDPERRQVTLASARRLTAESPRRGARDVYRKLLVAGVAGRPVKSRCHDEVIKDRHGQPLFRIRQQAKSVAVLLPIEKVSEQALGEIRDAVADILTPRSLRVSEYRPSWPAAVRHRDTLPS